MKIGLFGGRFDPIHVGHLNAGKEALENYKLDEVWFVPYSTRNLNKSEIRNPKSETNLKLQIPHVNSSSLQDKEFTVQANNLQRLEMVGIAIKNEKRFKVSDIEIKRGGVSYTIDTVLELKKTYPNHEFFWIIGEDLTTELPKWKEFEKLKREIKFIVVKNKKEGDKKLSSSEIRERVERRLPITGTVTKEIEEYIKKFKLYT